MRECFHDFVDCSCIVEYADLKYILIHHKTIYKQFKEYALTKGFNDKQINNYFYGELIQNCKEWIMNEKLEQINEDFND